MNPLVLAVAVGSAFGLVLIAIRQRERKNRQLKSTRRKRYIERSSQPLRMPSIRRFLISVHMDLFVIDRKILSYENGYPLSDFEILVLVLEDRRFLRHSGVDLLACARELIKALLLRRHGGASTIDMQFVRTATGYRDVTLKRKIYEIILSVIIQYRYPKRVILRSYLNCAFFGSQLIGTNRAAQKMFNIKPVEMNLEQASILASMLVYPRPLNPDGSPWRKKVLRRAEYGYRRMIRLKQSFEEIPR